MLIRYLSHFILCTAASRHSENSEGKQDPGESRSCSIPTPCMQSEKRDVRPSSQFWQVQSYVECNVVIQRLEGLVLAALLCTTKLHCLLTQLVICCSSLRVIYHKTNSKGFSSLLPQLSIYMFRTRGWRARGIRITTDHLRQAKQFNRKDCKCTKSWEKN